MTFLPRRWELTPAEMFGRFHFIQSKPAARLSPETLPFACEKRPLDGTPFAYQLALSDRSVTWDVQAVREAQPELPLSGDRRAGVLAFEGQRIVGSLVVPGNLTTQGYKLWVEPAGENTPSYRQKGLAFRLLVEWCYQTAHPPVLRRNGITLHSAKALLSAHRVVVERAVRDGKAVPERVLAAIASGEEAAAIVLEATYIENLEPPVRRRRFSLLHGREATA